LYSAENYFGEIDALLLPFLVYRFSKEIPISHRVLELYVWDLREFYRTICILLGVQSEWLRWKECLVTYYILQNDHLKLTEFYLTICILLNM
jgi:hypothetical protein